MHYVKLFLSVYSESRSFKVFDGRHGCCGRCHHVAVFATGITIALSASFRVSCVSARVWFLLYSFIQTRFNHVQAGKSSNLEKLVFW